MNKQIINMGDLNMSLPGGTDAGEAVAKAQELAKKINKKLDDTPGLRDLTRILYTIEHMGLPYMFFKSPALMGAEHDVHAVIGVLWQSAAKMENIPPPRMLEFKVEKLTIEGGDVMLVRTPFPFIMPLCYRVAMITTKDGERRFLTQERTHDLNDSMLCGWGVRNGTDVMEMRSLAHTNYGFPLNRRRSAMIEAAREVITGSLKPHPQIGFTYR